MNCESHISVRYGSLASGARRLIPAVFGNADDRSAEIPGDPAEQPDVHFLRAVDRQLLREVLEVLATEFASP